LNEILAADPEMMVVGMAVNGQDAIAKALELKPDVITMDVEMPVMDGIAAVREILKSQRIPILMFSSLTHAGAKATLDALEAGAVDFLPKKFEDIARDKAEAIDLLRQRVKAVARRRSLIRSNTAAPLQSSTSPTAKTDSPAAIARTPLARAQLLRGAEAVDNSHLERPFRASGKKTQLLAIGTSTGGPVALQTIITTLPKNFPVPILLIQHMPAAFTGAFASRLNSLAKIEVKEAADGDILRAGVAYLAPGGKQMLLEGTESNCKIRIKDDDSPRITFKPSVDITFGSAAKVYADKVLAVVLTGMGSDGREGARLLKQYGARVWAQDEASSVVYGMPQAVTAAGLTDVELSLADFSAKLQVEIGNG
jgi:two-component system chemotaxis response regulator CheB